MSESTPAKKLNSGAKAFVPSASASSWTPTPSKGDKTEQPPKNVTPEKAAAASKAAPASPAKKEAAPAPAPAPPKVAAPAPSVWGKKPTSAIRSAPTEGQRAKIDSQEQNHRDREQWNHGGRRNGNHDNDKDDKSGWRNNKKPDNGNYDNNKDDKSGWRNNKKPDNGNHDNNKDDKSGWRNNKKPDTNWSRGKKQQTKKEDDGWQRGKLVPLDLIKPEEGDNDTDKAVKRVVVGELLAMRLSFVAPPLIWENEGVVGPPDECRWIADTRVQEIDAMASKQRQGGDVSSHKRKKKEIETAPALEDCKPLEVNDNTRWKSNVFKGAEKTEEDTDSDEVVLKKALLILNKLSLTKFEKLSDAFIATGIGRNVKCMGDAIELIVKKAQDEPHFAAMYAGLCLKLSCTPMDFEEPGKKKKFKKMLLTQCQREFETDTATKIADAVKDVEEEEERNLKKIIIKKHYLGHMRFIGELYKGDMINIKIMLMVLPQLLEGHAEGVYDEEKVECFSKLMSVIGSILEQQSSALRDVGKTDNYDKLMECWDIVEILAGRKSSDKAITISNRIKFMVQDLLEMRENGWTTRREEESAMTIAQIHKEAAKEARRGPVTSSSMNRSNSSHSFRQNKPSIDKDGFVEVVGPAGGGFNRSQSLGNFNRSGSRNNLRKSKSKSKNSTSSFAALDETKPDAKKKSVPKEVTKKPKVDYLSPKECGDKAKNYMKEYFVGGDADDAVLSIHELIGAGDEGSVDRGAKVVESNILMILEMKTEDVEKFLVIIRRCYEEKKIESASFSLGLNDPLEFLSDIAIDAPLATPHMATVVSAFVKAEAISFDYLLSSPEYFRTDCGAAAFGSKVLKSIGGDATTTASNVTVIEKLMTDDDRAQYSTAADLIAA